VIERMATSTAAGTIPLEALRGSGRRRRKERAVRWTLLAAAVASMLVSALIVVWVAGGAIRFLANIELGQLLADGWYPRSNDFGIPTLLAGTMLIVLISSVVAVPMGLGAAMYLSEYARPRIRRLLKPILETLAGIPSVVLGFFALATINPFVVQALFDSAGTFTLAAAGIAVGILLVPLVASVAEDAMHAVPGSLREAAYGIGARRRTVTARVVFPAAVSGIVAAIILGVSRAIGETMIIAIAAGATGGAEFTLNPLERGQTMTGAIASLAIGSDQVRGADQAFNSLYFVGLLLFVLTLALNLASERFVRRVRKAY
jgi:phosphate transport system permease protein